MKAIETTALTKQFGNQIAVYNLDLSIEDGEMFALLGINGAGKTTIIRMLTCLTAPTSGDATIYGKSILQNREAVKAMLNVSPQETAIAPNLTVEENLRFIAGIYGNNIKAAKMLATEFIEKFHMQQISLKLARTLSGGWQRRLSIAMALISSPKVLFLDEPTLGLDVLARRELWEILSAQKGKMTIILTTHYLEEAEALADRIAILSQGRLRAVGTVAELKTLAKADRFEDAFIALATAKEEEK